MKRRVLIGIRIVCFFTICVCIMYYLSNVLTTTKVGEYPLRSGFFQNIAAEDDNTIDVLFVGDSSVMHAVCPEQIWKDTKITSYNISYSVMKPQEAYFDLKKVFEKQLPKYVFIEAQFLVGMKKDGFDYYTNNAENIVDFVDDEISGEINCFLPVMKYKSEWKTRHLSDLITKHPDKINNIFKGYKYAPETNPFLGKHTDESEGIADFKYSGNIYFDKIFKLCKDNECEVILFNLPQGTGWNKKLHNKVSELATDYGIKYTDYDINLEEDIPDFSWETDTKDSGGHLNYQGATKLTSKIEKILVDYCNLEATDLSESQVKKWDEDMQAFYDIANGKVPYEY